jgi:hypothetical protein
LQLFSGEDGFRRKWELASGCRGIISRNRFCSFSPRRLLLRSLRLWWRRVAAE